MCVYITCELPYWEDKELYRDREKFKWSVMGGNGQLDGE